MFVSVKNLSIQLSKRLILDSIDCEFRSGERIAVVGANGVGKTTFLRALGTCYLGETGSITMDGQILRRDRIDLRQRLHLLADDPVFAGETPIDHICQAALYYQRDLLKLKSPILNWLREFDLLPSAARPLALLSKGQRYKVAFVGLLAAGPDLWLMDEPFSSGVDPLGMAAIKREINKFTGQGGIAVFSTQIVELAEQFSDRVLVLSEGRLALDVATTELQNGVADRALEKILHNLKVSKC